MSLVIRNALNNFEKVLDFENPYDLTLEKDRIIKKASFFQKIINLLISSMFFKNSHEKSLKDAIDFSKRKIDKFIPYTEDEIIYFEKANS
ncbi:MAG: hypothetical protein JXA94_04230, partial [Parachlamydiales bacterium]|nr:hypothetical protein [Parachlamydiales bacterium]